MTEGRQREIRRLADSFRQGCHRIGYRIADIFGECERRGYCVLRYPLPQTVRGFAQVREGDSILFSNSSLPYAREIYALGTELGHLLMHVQESGQFVDDGETLNEAGEEKRREAEYFAICLLMPESEVYRYIHLVLEERDSGQWDNFDLARMMTAFQVDFEMLTERLQMLGWLRESDVPGICSEKRREKVNRLLRVFGSANVLDQSTKEKRIPEKYLEWVVSNYKKGMIRENTLERVLEYFDTRIEDLR